MRIGEVEDLLHLLKRNGYVLCEYEQGVEGLGGYNKGYYSPVPEKKWNELLSKGKLRG